MHSSIFFSRAAGPNVPPGRIFGSGTALDSSRLQSLISASFDVDTNAVHGFIIGEHGDSSVPVWSGISVGGSLLLPPGEEPNEAHKAMHADVITAGSRVIQKKGYTNWAIGLSIARIATAVLTDERAFMPVSTCVRGYQGVKEDVFLSLPCCLGATGVVRVLDIKLTEAEAEAFRKSAASVWEVQADVWESWKE
jgi:L-lactate dehydrogenase